MTAPVLIERNGHRTFLKWHRARRRLADPVFTGARIIEGMREGASVEVDLVVHADQGFAVLHDTDLGAESTGSGRVRDKSAAQLRQLNLRDNDGMPIADHVLLLEDLAALLAQGGVHPDALLQLDYKEDAAALSTDAVANFSRAVAPVARNMILSSGDAASVALLTDATPGLKLGYDPCDERVLGELAQTHDFAGFVAKALAASPRAEMIYLAWELVLGAADLGFDLVAAFHTANKRIDAYTIRTADPDGLSTIEALLALKVDQITTDDPEGVFAKLG